MPVLMLAMLTLVSCQQQDDLRPSPSTAEVESKGRIVLSLSSDPEVYIETRSTQLSDISSLNFTLSGNTTNGESINNVPLTFNNDGTDNEGRHRFAAIFEAGTYTLTATTKTTISAPTNGAGAPAYSGTSNSFTITQGGTATTSIDLGTPTNAKITVALDNTFSTKYEQPRITITDGTRSVTITDAATAAEATTGQSTYGLPTVTYFDVPANGTLSYSITADAKSGSQVTDIRGATGTITIASGRHTVITLTANSVTGEVIPIIGGEDYEGAFD
jgi:hypothetical protein